MLEAATAGLRQDLRINVTQDRQGRLFTIRREPTSPQALVLADFTDQMAQTAGTGRP
ncbi:hypothetical protein [Dactylosporangium sp. NPDC000521]|uniref:hypothetical protein n=1 Tax=Dactylosporangium sp. NPDC000521 TaxID=3363975 RepID=UPI003676427D